MSTSTPPPTKPAASPLIAPLIAFAVSVTANLTASIVKFFFEVKPGDLPPEGIPVWDAALALAAHVCVVVSIAMCLWVLITRQRHSREQYALVLTMMFLALAAGVGVSLWLNLYPWNLGDVWRVLWWWAPTPRPVIGWADRALLVVLAVVVFVFLKRFHTRWTGLVTLDQHEADQRQEKPRVLAEAWRELNCLLGRRKRSEPYLESDPGAFGTAVVPDEDERSWEEEAKDLVATALPHFDFADGEWEPEGGCWIGRHVSFNRPVLLHPCQDWPSAGEVDHLAAIRAGLTVARGLDAVELVVAVYATPAEPDRPGGAGLNIYTRDELLGRLTSKFNQYAAKLRERYRVSKLQDSELVVADVYVKPKLATSVSGTGNRVRTTVADRYVKLATATPDEVVDAEECLDNWLGEPGRRHISVLGEYGQGKSTFALAWAVRHLEAALRRSGGRIPLLIELRGTSPRNMTPAEMLGAWGAKYGLDGALLLHLHRAGRLLLIFEGFDEMALVGDGEMRLKHFRTLWSLAGRGSKIVITGRPNFFLDDREMHIALGIDRPTGDNAYSVPFRLQPFGVTEIEQALRNAPPSVRTQIVQVAGRSPHFLELISRPSVLHMVSTLWEEHDLMAQVNELTSARVMGLFTDKSYRRQGEKEMPGKPGFSQLTTPERKYFMSGVAAHMAAKGLMNHIDKDELNQITDRLLETIPKEVSGGGPATTPESSVELRLRLAGNPRYGQETVRTDVRTTCLLVDDPASPGRFRFAHKSVQEYLLAEVVYRWSAANDPVATSIVNTCRVSTDTLLKQPVSFRYYTEMHVDALSAEPDRDARHRKAVQRIFETTAGRTPVRWIGARLTANLKVATAVWDKWLRAKLGFDKQRRPRPVSAIVTLALLTNLPILLAMMLILFIAVKMSLSSWHDPVNPWPLPGLLMTIFLLTILTKTTVERRDITTVVRAAAVILNVDAKYVHRIQGTAWIPRCEMYDLASDIPLQLWSPRHPGK